MGWKYIILEIAEGYKFPIIFPDKLVHKDVAEALRRCCPGKGAAIATSAGSIGILEIQSAYGESETLKLKSLELVTARAAQEWTDPVNSTNFNLYAAFEAEAARAIAVEMEAGGLPETAKYLIEIARQQERFT